MGIVTKEMKNDAKGPICGGIGWLLGDGLLAARRTEEEIGRIVELNGGKRRWLIGLFAESQQFRKIVLAVDKPEEAELICQLVNLNRDVLDCTGRIMDHEIKIGGSE